MQQQRGRGPGRKKYAELIRFLKSVIKNEDIGLRVRMSAAERLDGIYARHEQREFLEFKRAERLAAGTQDDPEDPESPEPVAQEPQSKEDALKAAQEFLDRIKNRRTTSDEEHQ
jgi:hypothetical protein